ncbi:hypothetical protein DLM78_10530 [Leptospira stimsonii]|uniref:Uncharacterized protein n=1 Tax=Leptospira stimsonii TaxID=2202203 RepID=A0A8B3CQI5_9LEPT|nr:hypothetical protein DLM78_10530 [Leptospira stimsonii]
MEVSEDFSLSQNRNFASKSLPVGTPQNVSRKYFPFLLILHWRVRICQLGRGATLTDFEKNCKERIL